MTFKKNIDSSEINGTTRYFGLLSHPFRTGYGNWWLITCKPKHSVCSFSCFRQIHVMFSLFRFQHPFVTNCVNGDSNPSGLPELIEKVSKTAKEYPLPRMYRKPYCSRTESRWGNNGYLFTLQVTKVLKKHETRN